MNGAVSLILRMLLLTAAPLAVLSILVMSRRGEWPGSKTPRFWLYLAVGAVGGLLMSLLGLWPMQ